ncbi:hypothetical protein PAPYR_5337 [Paratrimastix pyriformis]|uniref:Uncharacterized protein n=1 Tax=Paratrimastix pyriformis TaxID=342808 RepID=A0ABQ8UHU9_9EUKA|nr:hypothetical protein PAPYR_5337 [Paratrimastix pyriformis]
MQPVYQVIAVNPSQDVSSAAQVSRRRNGAIRRQRQNQARGMQQIPVQIRVARTFNRPQRVRPTKIAAQSFVPVQYIQPGQIRVVTAAPGKRVVTTTAVQRRRRAAKQAAQQQQQQQAQVQMQMQAMPQPVILMQAPAQAAVPRRRRIPRQQQQQAQLPQPAFVQVPQGFMAQPQSVVLPVMQQAQRPRSFVVGRGGRGRRVRQARGGMIGYM